MDREWIAAGAAGRRGWLLLCIAAFALPILFFVSQPVHHALQRAALRARRMARARRPRPATPFETSSIKTPAPRKFYRFSVIPGGVYSADEFRAAAESDAVIGRHYATFDMASLRMVRNLVERRAFVSYRIGRSVFWTRQPVRVLAGEWLITDGVHEARARCGNRISIASQLPVVENRPEPTEDDLSAVVEERVSPTERSLAGSKTDDQQATTPSGSSASATGTTASNGEGQSGEETADSQPEESQDHTSSPAVIASAGQGMLFATIVTPILAPPSRPGGSSGPGANPSDGTGTIGGGLTPAPGPSPATLSAVLNSSPILAPSPTGPTPLGPVAPPPGSPTLAIAGGITGGATSPKTGVTPLVGNAFAPSSAGSPGTAGPTTGTPTTGGTQQPAPQPSIDEQTDEIVTPEPGTYALVGLALAAGLFLRRR